MAGSGQRRQLLRGSGIAMVTACCRKPRRMRCLKRCEVSACSLGARNVAAT